MVYIVVDWVVWGHGIIVGFGGWSRMFRVCRLVLNTYMGV